MESDNKLKQTDTKNDTCFYFNVIITFEVFDFDILINKKSYKNILVYNIPYKTLNSAKPLHIRFDKIDIFFRIYDQTRYLVFFEGEKYDSIYNRIRYLIGVKKIITYVFSHNYAVINVDSQDYLPVEKTLTFHNVIILIKSVFRK